ncbi:MAG: 3-hydroxyacyl-ACP dehydratase FabZ family protein [Planctomycetota bacterium]
MDFPCGFISKNILSDEFVDQKSVTPSNGPNAIGVVIKEAFVPFSEFDYDKVLVDQEGIRKVNPHRFEMMLLDGILYTDEDQAVGYLDVQEDAFWIRGHFPDRPLMPGVLICESAAQLSSYYAITHGLVTSGMVGLGGLTDVRFRGPVVPGDRLTLMLRKGKARIDAMFNAAFQGFVNETLVVDGTIKGVALR